MGKYSYVVMEKKVRLLGMILEVWTYKVAFLEVQGQLDRDKVGVSMCQMR